MHATHTSQQLLPDLFTIADTAQFKHLPLNPYFHNTCVDIGLKYVFSSNEPFTLCSCSYLLLFLIVVALLRRNLQVSISLDGVCHVYPVHTTNVCVCVCMPELKSYL
jgi:hypothetical protein